MLRAQLRGHAEEHGCSRARCVFESRQWEGGGARALHRSRVKSPVAARAALLVTFYGVKLETIKSVTADKDFSVCETRGAYTDFSRVGFTIETTEGKTLTVKSDRCGGSFNEAIVYVNGEEKFRSVTPDAALEKQVAAMEAQSPGLMPYFYLQDEDYITLKVSAALVGRREQFASETSSRAGTVLQAHRRRGARHARRYRNDRDRHRHPQSCGVPHAHDPEAAGLLSSERHEANGAARS